MSQFTAAENTDEDGGKLFAYVLSSRFFLLNAFDKTAGKDRYPDIDGQIRLKDGVKDYLNSYLHYQLKSTKNLKNEKFPCSGSILDYLMSTNVPTLLIIADVKNKKVYWFFLDDGLKKKYRLKKKGNKSITLDLSSQIITQEDALELNNRWQKFAKEDNYTELADSVSKIATSFHQDLQKTLGLLYLFQRIEKKKVADFFNVILKVDKKDVESIIQKLAKEGVISATANYYLLDNKRLGVESLHKLLEDLDLASLEQLLKEDDRKRVLKQLATVEHKGVKKYLSGLTKEIFALSKNVENNDEFYARLELLDQFAYRFPKETVLIVKNLIQATPQPSADVDYGAFGLMKGKNHKDLLIKSVEVLNDIRYVDPRVFDILITLSQNAEKSISEKATEALVHLSQYNLQALKRFGYGVQLSVLGKVERWGKEKLLTNTLVLSRIGRELLKPVFEGTSMKDENTMVFHSGPLKPTSEFKDIRKRMLRILQKTYVLLSDVAKKKVLIETMDEASRTPHSVGYGEDIENAVIDNANDLIVFYLSILTTANNPIIKVIEKHTQWLSKRFGSKKLPRLEELKSLIASKDEYGMFKVFVGYDYDFADGNWEEARKVRNEKVQQFVASVTQFNFAEWERKTVEVAKDLPVSDHGEFQYFNTFLYELGKQKPVMALKLIDRVELQPFLIHIIAGIWNSSLQSEARKIVQYWVKKGENLSTVAWLFDYIEQVDEKILGDVFKKAKQLKDIPAISNIVSSIARVYEKQKGLKNLFLKSIRELSKNNNFWWIQSIGYRSEAIFNDLTEADFDRVLKDIALLPNVDHYAEDILVSVAKKNPKKVIDFFYRRVSIKARKQNDIDDQFDAVPYNMHTIGEALQKQEKKIVPILLEWYRKGNKETKWLFEWEASHLFEKIFPQFSPVLGKSLANLLKEDRKDALNVVFSVLSKYDDETNLWNVVRVVIAKYAHRKNYKKVRDILFGLLSQTGVITGEYGFVRAMETKKKSLPEVEGDTKEFKRFLREYSIYLDKKIEYERKKADEDSELRKRSVDF